MMFIGEAPFWWVRLGHLDRAPSERQAPSLRHRCRAPYFSDAERAALALADAMTRLADGADPLPDDIWVDAAKHYDERALSGLMLWIATTNLFNRLNVATRQVAGAG